MSFSLPESIYRYFYLRRKRDAESRRTRIEGVPVVSIGNITTGGTGKTPAVQWLAEKLAVSDLRPAIVGRGYKGKLSESGAVVSDGGNILLSADEAGDEALLHARTLKQVPVIIGRDRERACRTAQQKFSPGVIVLGDGFQYWSLARDFDLVLLDARRPFGNGKLLPLGRLREPVHALQRATAILLTRADRFEAAEIARSRAMIGQITDAPVFTAAHQPVAIRDESNGAVMELEYLAGRKVGALSALANNQTFLDTLVGQGAEVVLALEHKDHHSWSEAEVRAFAQAAQQQGAQILVTTTKDAVKMEGDWTQPLPLYSLEIKMKIDREEELWRLIEACLRP